MDYAIACSNIVKKVKQLVYYLKSIKYSEYYYKYLEYIKKLIKDFKGLNYLRFASFSYIPLFGWILPLTMKKDNPFCGLHAKQGFFLSVIFVVTAVILNLINIYSPVEWRGFRLGIVISIYVFYLAYIIISLIAAWSVLKGKPFNIKIFQKYADLIKL
ncbi:MAG: hypothetical protein V1874_13860 [Spirochaetota bacterium]